MNRRHSHIAFLLLLLLGITFMPFNFLHHHAEDEHGMMVHHPEQASAHHCELDDHFCQPDAQATCGHEHIARTIAKCFSCEFSFIKQFTSSHFSFEFYEAVIYKRYRVIHTDTLLEALVLLSNKGPPVLA